MPEQLRVFAVQSSMGGSEVQLLCRVVRVLPVTNSPFFAQGSAVCSVPCWVQMCMHYWLGLLHSGRESLGCHSLGVYADCCADTWAVFLVLQLQFAELIFESRSPDHSCPF
jgi:hypothetical protein